MGTLDPQSFGDLTMLVAMVTAMTLAAWIVTTWMRVRHGYPLKGSRGEQLYPRLADETAERLTIATQENAQLRAELGSVKDRLATVERIVTDGSFRLDREIERLRAPAN